MPFLHLHSILINHLAGSGEVCKEEVRNMSRGAIIARHQLQAYSLTGSDRPESMHKSTLRP